VIGLREPKYPFDGIDGRIQRGQRRESRWASARWNGLPVSPPMQRRAVVQPERISLDEAIIYGGVHASKKV
jgi:hypothetical protein